MNEATFKAFGDEIVKIAFFQKLRGGFVNALREGWHGTPEQIAAGEGSTWFGRGRQIKPEMGRKARIWEEATSLGGATRALPIGAKSMMMLGTGLMARDAIRPQDPSGRDRSRAERVTGLAGNTIGGLVGSALASRALPGSKLLAPLAGGVAGGMLGEKAITMPWTRNRAPSQRPFTQQVARQVVPDQIWSPQPMQQAPVNQGGVA